MVSLSPDCVGSTAIKCIPSCDEQAMCPATAAEPRRQGQRVTDLMGTLLEEFDAIPSPNGRSDRGII